MEEAIADLRRMESTLADQKTYSGLAPDELTELLTRAGTKRRALERVEEKLVRGCGQTRISRRKLTEGRPALALADRSHHARRFPKTELRRKPQRGLFGA